MLYELSYCVARSQRRRENAERLRVFLSGNIDVAHSTKKMPWLPAIGALRWKRQERRLAPMTS